MFSEARGRLEITAAARDKVTEGIKKLTDIRPVILDYVSLAMEVVTKQLPEIAEKLGKEMITACETNASLLQSALKHLEGRERHPENETVRLLESLKSLAEVDAVELVTCKLDLREMMVEEMVRSGIHFEVSLKKAGRKELARLPSPGGGRTSGKTGIPKVSESGKKQAGKGESKKTYHSVSKSSYGLNSSVDYYSTESPANGKSVDPLPGHTARKKPEIQAKPPSESIQVASFQLLDVCTEEEAETLKPDHPSPDPPAQRPYLPQPEPVSKKPTVHTPDSQSEKTGASGQFSRLQAARLATRSTYLRDTEKKVEELESQLKSLKSSLPFAS